MADDSLAGLSRQFVDRFLEFHPGTALALGRHEHDHRLEDLSEGAIEAFCGDLDGLLARAVALPAAGLTPAGLVDRDVLVSKIRSVLHDYRTIQPWRHDPYWYSEVLSGPLNSILIYDYAPPAERLAAVVARERLIPAFAARVRENLRAPAPIMIRYGIQGFEGALTIVGTDLPRSFAGAGDAALQAAFADSTRVATEALRSLVEWMKAGLVAGGDSAYALGSSAYEGWLLHAEMIETPVSELERWALGEIESARAAMRACAAKIRPSSDVEAVVLEVTSDHPPTGQVVPTLRTMAEDIYRWLETANVVTIPAPDRVLIADTPEFMRWSFGSMWVPGPFEKPGVASTFYATDADPDWSVEKQDEHLAAFCYRGLENLTIHEAYPGHFIQGLHQNRVEDALLRKCFWWGVFGEGWAHYCEQMALEQGFGGGAPEVRIVQLQEALNRLCRFVNGIRLHTRADWSTEDGTAFFREKAWMTEAVARAESERGTFDPFYLRYTLGKKLILDLREECRRALGSRFSLKAFHDALLGCGSAPMPALARLTRLRLGVPDTPLSGS